MGLRQLIRNRWDRFRGRKFTDDDILKLLHVTRDEEMKRRWGIWRHAIRGLNAWQFLHFVDEMHKLDPDMYPPVEDFIGDDYGDR